MAAQELTWLACDLRSGRIAAELRSLASPSGGIGRKLGGSTSAQFDLALGGVPRQWEAATDPGRALLVAVDSASGTPLWPGIILTRAGGSGPTVQLGAVTPEGYLDRRYLGDYTATRDRALIMADLVGSIVGVDAPPFVVDAPAAGGEQLLYRLLDQDDRTVLSALQELDAAEGSPEWTVDVQWTDVLQTQIKLVFRVRPRIGVQSVTPGSRFDMPGAITGYVLTESYEAGKGATSVRAWGDGQGAARLHSPTLAADTLIAAGWCRWDYRYTPAVGTTDPVQLAAHAAQSLLDMGPGSRAWAVTAATAAAPRLGADWQLGDSVGVDITSSPRHPTGATAVARAYAWSLDAAGGTVTPTLLEDET